MANKEHLAKFIFSIRLTLAVFIIFTGLFAIYVYSEKEVDRANEQRIRSLLLADELRQSSDDLTRMARSYVMTGEPRFKQHFQEILDMQNGKRPRPVDYQNVYWDLVLEDDHRPRPFAKQAVSLLDLMREFALSEEELGKLALAKEKSDELTKIEWTAMALIDAAKPVTEAIRLQASVMLYDATYHRAKYDS